MSTQTGQGPLRLNAPNYQVYDTGIGEASVLRGITPDTMGAMYGMLLNQRGMQDTRQAEYGEQLGAVNRQQGILANRKIESDDQASMRTALTGLVQHGDMPTSAALRGMGITNVPSPMNAEEAGLATLEADDARLRTSQATGYQRANEGAYAGVQAGINPDMGQIIRPGTAGTLAARRTVGQPLALQREALSNIGRASSDAAGNKGKVTWNPASNDISIELRGDPASSLDQVNSLRARQQATDRTRITGQGGNTGAGGASAGQSGRQPPPSGGNQPQSPPGTPRPLLPADKARLSAQVGNNARLVQTPDGKVFVAGSKGRVPWE